MSADSNENENKNKNALIPSSSSGADFLTNAGTMLASPNFNSFLQVLANKDSDPATRALSEGTLNQGGFIAVKAIDGLLAAFKSDAEIKLKMVEVAGKVAERAGLSLDKMSEHASEAMKRQHELQQAAIVVFRDNLASITAEAVSLRNRAEAHLKDLNTTLTNLKKEWTVMETSTEEELPTRGYNSRQKRLEMELDALNKRIAEADKRLLGSNDELIGQGFIAFAKDSQANLINMLDKNVQGLLKLQTALAEAQRDISVSLTEFAKIMQQNQKGALQTICDTVVGVVAAVKGPRQIKEKTDKKDATQSNPGQPNGAGQFSQKQIKQTSETNAQNNEQPGTPPPTPGSSS